MEQGLHFHNCTVHFQTPPGTVLGSLMDRFAPVATAAPISSGERVTPAGSAPTIGQPWAGQGGIYLGIAPAFQGMPARHLIVSTDETAKAWGPYDTNAPATDHVDGQANTDALVATGDYPAATWARAYTADGHNDFHLPSRLDLLYAYLLAPQIFHKSGWYWSSTQASRYCAFAQTFEYGSSVWDDETNEFRVRAFRTIHLTT